MHLLDYPVLQDADFSQRFLAEEIALAAKFGRRVLVTADSLAAARDVESAIRKRMESPDLPVTYVCCASLCGSLSASLRDARGLVVLEDVGSLDAQAQSELFYLLEEGLTPFVRLISTAGPDLYSAVEAGQFLEPLYYRLNMIHVWAGRPMLDPSEPSLGLAAAVPTPLEVQ
jgi:hypothetical protein